MLKRTTAALVAALGLLAAAAASADDFPSASGGLRSTGVVPQVLNGSNQAVPVSNANPLPVGGNTAAVTVTPTITSASAYASGQWLGGKLSFAGAARATPPGSGMVQSVVITDASKQNASIDLVLFNADPATTTITDKTTADINSADLGKVIGVVHLSDWTSGSTSSIGQAQQQAIPFALPSGTTVYGAMIVRSTPTYGSTSAVGVTLRVLQD
jgi:hypothetical protein